MKKNINEKKLSLNKVKISKINNLNSIKGGIIGLEKIRTCAFPDNASKDPQEPIKI
ncbi:hypothetical protein [Chryseobacterium gleum]|uniref:hypothetical protein n=1 Tax=Chryseobacterium gleum TaxID=250 RepID=UPI001E3BB0CF|nr:hypothetical protein [Chryseobacterium gleum]MCD9616613.1 hypothetical protein [Chryseobacterium gleum]